MPVTPDSVGARTVAAAVALQPFGLHLIVHKDYFVVSDKPDEIGETAMIFPVIGQVEDFIAGWQRGAAKAGAAAPLRPAVPRVGDKAHYVSHGSPVREDGTQAYRSECRAAIVTEVPPVLHGDVANGSGGRWEASLFVINPEGTFFKQGLRCDPGTFAGPEREAMPGEPLPQITCDDLTFEGGTWHQAGD